MVMDRYEERRILFDAREFMAGRYTGIGKALAGLVAALTEGGTADRIDLAVQDPKAVPDTLRNREDVRLLELPRNFLASEKALSALCGRRYNLFVSPYPKLPLFGCRCKTIHTVHDVFYLTHGIYRRRLKTAVDRFRLKRDLRRSDLTWYDSRWSMKETHKLVGTNGKNPRVRFLAVDDQFSEHVRSDPGPVLNRYGLVPGYILVLGNGLPHKNLGVLLSVCSEVKREMIFAGVPEENRRYWQERYSDADVTWIDTIDDEHLPRVLQQAFCLAQPSTDEGYGYPPLEAMSCGIPAVVSRIPVLLETTGGNALQASPFRSVEWLDAFSRLETHDVHSRCVKSGLKWVQGLRGRAGWKGHIADIEGLIGEP